jgi:hypothetical protein
LEIYLLVLNNIRRYIDVSHAPILPRNKSQHNWQWQHTSSEMECIVDGYHTPTTTTKHEHNVTTCIYFTGKRRSNAFEALKTALNKEAGTIFFFFGALIFAGYFSVLSTLPSQLEEKYNFNSLQIGLCFLPYGVGSLTSR